jgi:hypothetical protein
VSALDGGHNEAIDGASNEVAITGRYATAKIAARFFAIEIFVHLCICAFKVFRKCALKNGLVRLVSLSGVHPQAAIGFAIKGQRQPLFTLSLFWC